MARGLFSGPLRDATLLHCVTLRDLVTPTFHILNSEPSRVAYIERKRPPGRLSCSALCFTSFYRAMLFSAYARSWDRMCPSVRPSVCDVGDL